MIEPTSEQCTASDRIRLPDGRDAIATWYPSMGGHVGKCLIVEDGGCVEVAVWHDGEFPFAGATRPPTVLHHCDPASFIRFGELAAELAAEAGR